MKTLKEFAKKTTAGLVTDMVAHEKMRWPPYCLSFAFQPMRPVKENTPTGDKTKPISKP